MITPEYETRIRQPTFFHPAIRPTKRETRTKATLRYLAKCNESRSDESLDKWESPKSVALLVEANTAFGQSIFKLRKDEKLSPDIQHLLFPLHISRLEATYEKSQREQDAKAGLPTVDALIPQLGDPPSDDNDLIPLQDPSVTPSVNGKVLSNLLSIISRNHIRYVGIIATDPRDKLFLASAVHDHCPGVQVFIIGSDLILSLPEYAFYLKGTIVGSTYPLIPVNQFWTNPDRDKNRVVFPSESAQGYYNAIRAQLDEPRNSKIIEYRKPYFPGLTAGSDETKYPPIWVTMVGQNGELVPLQFFTDQGTADEKEYVFQGPESVTTTKALPLDFPRAPLIALVILCSAIILLFYYAFSNPGAQLFWKKSGLVGYPTFWTAMFYRAICFGSVGMILFPVVGLSIYGQHLALDGLGDGLVVVLLLVPQTALLLLGPALLWPHLRRTQTAFARAWAFWVAVGWFILFLGWMVWCHLAPSQDSWHALFFWRSLNFTSGVSVLLPLVFLSAAFFCWAFFELRGWVHFRRFRVRPCYSGLGRAQNYQGFQRVRALGLQLTLEGLGLLRFASRHRAQSASVLFVMFFGAWQLGLLYVPTAEGFVWTWGFFIAFTVAAILVGFSFLRFLALWSSLKTFLHETALIPMVGAFQKLPTTIASEFGTSVHAVRPRHSHQRVARQQLKLLGEETVRLLGAAIDAPVREKDLRALSEAIRRILELENEVGESRDGKNEEYVLLLGVRLNRLSRTITGLLTTVWPRRPLDQAFGSSAADQPALVTEAPRGEKESLEKWIGLAEGFVAIQVVTYLSQFFVRLRNLALSMVVCSCLLLFAVTSYPFQPERLFLYTFLGLFGAVLAGILYVLFSVNYNNLISRIAGTTPNRFTPDGGFLMSLVTYIIPALGLVVLQLTGSFRFLLEPVLRALK